MKQQILSELKCEERKLIVPFSVGFDELEKYISSQFPKKQILRFISSNFNKQYFQAHVLLTDQLIGASNIFKLKKREFENEKKFNVCFLIPTGIRCEIGGHAGDSLP